MAGLDLATARDAMVEGQLQRRGISDAPVLAAFRSVPREAFVGAGLEEFAYSDTALPIDAGQTISQPYIVALMLEALQIRPTDRVLEVGAGSGYAAAILAQLAAHVYAIERHRVLADAAAERLRRLGFDNVDVVAGDGTRGRPDHAPFDAILVSAGGPTIPQPLLDQLAPGGRLVIPVGDDQEQRLVRIVHLGTEWIRTDLGPVMFVPLIGEGGPLDGNLPAVSSPARGTPARDAPSSAASGPATAVAGPMPAVIRRLGLPALVAEGTEAIGSIEGADLGPLLERIGDSRLVLIGEASHGTSEFYQMRARITRDLIESGRIGFVALEADWPDAARIDRYVRLVDAAGRRDELEAFRRFPTWMWRNREVLAFVDWLHRWNRERPMRDRVAVHGLDLYSLTESTAEVIRYLDGVDPSLAELARRRYACLTPFESDPSTYARTAANDRYRRCEADVVAMLHDLLERRIDAAEHDGDRFFDAVQNARVVADAERYYRAAFSWADESWNLRDHHMFDVLLALLDAHGRAGAVWAHNSHLGDASATEMAARGELNVGQLARERLGDAVYSIGMGTHAGTVAAAHAWDGELQVMDVRPSRDDSYERVFHDAGIGAGLVPLRDAHPDEVRSRLMDPRRERAIGVIYRPETELLSHYFQARLPRQFDEYLWFDETTAVTPLERHPRLALGPGHPFARLDV